MNTVDIINYKTSGFAFFKGNSPSVLVQGPDTWDFLNRITTRKFSEANTNESVSCALLTGKAEVQCLFQAWNRGPQAVELFPLAGSQEALLLNLDKMHFSESIDFRVYDHLMWLELRGANIAFAKSAKVFSENIGGKQIVIFASDNWGIPGVLMGATEAEDLMMMVKSTPIPILTAEDASQIRNYFGFPDSDDFIKTYQILELGLDRFVDREKGCYPGQEVVEKIYTYGKPAKKLVRVRLKSDDEEIKKISSDQGKCLFSDTDIVGKWCQMHQLQEGESFCLAMVQRSVIEKGKIVSFGLNGPTGQIELLT